MVYLENRTGIQHVYIPSGGTAPDSVTMVLRSTMTLAEYRPDIVPYGRTGMYLSLGIRLPEGIPDGSYEYSLESGDAVVSSGCATVGDYGIHTVEYGKEIRYREYGG